MVCLRGCSCCKGACCIDDGVGGYTCSIQTCYDCDSNGGFWQGPGTTCNSSVACPCNRPADHRYCEKCENGTRGSRCIGDEYCDDGDCTEADCTSCVRDCEATVNGNSYTGECTAGDPSKYYEFIEGSQTITVYLSCGKTYGYGVDCGCDVSLQVQVFEPAPDRWRSFVYSGTLVTSDDGCHESVTVTDETPGLGTQCGGSSLFIECDGTGCEDLLPPDLTITYTCSDIACVIDSDCPEGYCCGAICTQGNCNPLP